MASTATPSVIRLATGAPADCETDLLVVPIFEGELPAAVPLLNGLDSAAGGEGGRAAASGEIRGRLYEAFVTPLGARGAKAARIAVIGAGKAADFDLERLRKVA